MPYKSEAQRRYFNVNRKKLEAQGVDVDEWNQASKGKKLPEKKANTPGQTGNIPVTPPTPVRPEAAPSGNIPRPARRQTTLADGRGFEAMAAKEAATPFFYLLGDLAKMAAHVKTANLPKQTVTKYPQSDRRKGPYPFKGGPGRLGLGQFPEPEPAPAPSYFDSARDFGSKLIPSFSQLKDFATSPLGIGTGIGLGGLGALAYMNSRPRRDEDEEKRAEGGIPTFGGGKPKDLLSKAIAFGKSLPNEDGPIGSLGKNIGKTIGSIYNPAEYANPAHVALARIGLQTALGSPSAPAPAPAPAPVAKPGLLDSIGQFATSPLGIGTGLGLGGLGALAYMNSRPRRDEDEEKEAGAGSEIAGAINPIYNLGPNQLALLAAAITPTRNFKQQLNYDDEFWPNVLIPGRGMYNMAKRTGASLRSPEMRAKQKEHLRKKNQQKLDTPKPAATDEKTAMLGSVPETLSLFNPLNMLGGHLLAGGAALATPTRSLESQAAHDADRTMLGHTADVLVPGLGAYNAFKRHGAMTQSREIRKMKALRELRKLEDEELEDASYDKEAGVKLMAKIAARAVIKQAADPTLTDKLTHYAGVPAALLGLGALSGTGVGAMAHPIQELFYSTKDKEARNRRLRERLLIGAGSGIGVGLAEVIRHLNSPISSST